MDIRHNEKESRFFVRLKEGECSLKYKKLTERLWNFESTSIPENSGEIEKNVLEEMIEYAINFVKEKGIKILVSCYDVQDYLIRHRNLKDLVYHPY
jgi:predicted GNAT family acetyltransferase